MYSWAFFALLSAGFAALVAIFGKIGLTGVDTTLATTVRAAIMAALLIAISFALGKAGMLSTLSGKALVFIALSGVAGALSWLFYFFALQKGPASGVAALDRLSVVFVLVLAVFFLGEHFTLKAVAGALLVVGGAILMSL
ncbi:MAG: EamA family transporter [Candidatus Azambacteria bacterium]|nr:EamA family transporter [Candidatus Azambacteria bacterium]